MLGEDFSEPSPLQVIFISGDAVNDTSCTTFGIENDDNLEFDHDFAVSLETITPNGPTISMPSSSTTVFISDDEGMHCIMYSIDSLKLEISIHWLNISLSSRFFSQVPVGRWPLC